MNTKPEEDIVRPHVHTIYGTEKQNTHKHGAYLFFSEALTRRNGSICVTHTHSYTIHRGIPSNYQAVNDCCASAVLQPFITRASLGPYWARETAYHTPHHLMGLMQPINQQKSGCEVRQTPPIRNTL